jgi:signal transduction histidine kinase
MTGGPVQRTEPRERRGGVDRRSDERRLSIAKVVLERRSAQERRLHQRRHTARRRWLGPALAGRGQRRTALSRTLPAISGLPPVLADAIRNVADTWHGVRDGADVEAVDQAMAALAQAFKTIGGTPAVVDPRLRSPLGGLILKRVRTELIDMWSGGRETRGHAAHDILAAMADLESVYQQVDEAADDFASRLNSPDGLTLVVEVAHDLRSPMTSILFLADGLQRGHSGPVNDLQRRQLGLIYSATLGLSEVVTNVIELARGESQLAKEECAPFSITDVLESVVDIARPLAEAKSLSITVGPPACPSRLGHPVPLTRILLNLVTNALKFTEEGFVEVRARETTLNRVEFSVRDTGPGISPEEQKTLFTPFRRASDSNRYRFSGSRLGLALCRRFLAGLGSELMLESTKGKGTRFFFELDLPPVDQV